MDTIFKAPKTYGPKTEQLPIDQCVCRLKNMAARLITLNVRDQETGEQYALQVIPGHAEPTNATPSAVNSAFCKHLIEKGDLIALPLEGAI
ncbi:hypothetical protein [Vibrio algivorus]|uniref:Uncharacterized protein n=1 Tax=Vibrio algivorus TaxID=1667024 RepID=A0ABQ6EPT3_9VIBR|nr:hypothetical protein [Vibrio algivorus]GLT15006.1 hypothetical protein GCM10007931_19810 [Vibrio algivorus]